MKYTNWLAGTRNWLAGPRISYADLAAAATLSVLDYLGEVDWTRLSVRARLVHAAEVAAVLPPAARRSRARADAGVALCGPRLLSSAPERQACAAASTARPRRPGFDVRGGRLAGRHPAGGRPASPPSWPRATTARWTGSPDTVPTARRPAGTVAGRALDRHARHELRPGPGSARALLDTQGSRRDLGLCAEPRLSRRREGQAQGRSPVRSRRGTGEEVKVFVDTAPLMEKPLAQRAGLGWQGKHTNLLSRDHGSWLFLGVILTASEIGARPARRAITAGPAPPASTPAPPPAFPAPFQLDARRCLSYLTIGFAGPLGRATLKQSNGDRIYGCDELSRGLSVEQVRTGPRRPRDARLQARDALSARRASPIWPRWTTPAFRSPCSQKSPGQADRPRSVRPQRPLRHRQQRRRREFIPAAERLPLGGRPRRPWCAARRSGRCRGCWRASLADSPPQRCAAETARDVDGANASRARSNAAGRTGATHDAPLPHLRRRLFRPGLRPR